MTPVQASPVEGNDRGNCGVDLLGAALLVLASRPFQCGSSTTRPVSATFSSRSAELGVVGSPPLTLARRSTSCFKSPDFDASRTTSAFRVLPTTQARQATTSPRTAATRMVGRKWRERNVRKTPFGAPNDLMGTATGGPCPGGHSNRGPFRRAGRLEKRWTQTIARFGPHSNTI